MSRYNEPPTALEMELMTREGNMNRADKNAARTPGRIKSRTRFAMRGYLWKIIAALPPYSREVMQGLTPVDLVYLTDIKRAAKEAEEHFFGRKI